MFERIVHDLRAFVVATYFAILGGRDFSLKASFEKEYRLFSRSGKGFSINGVQYLSVLQSRQNMMCIGPSGLGKSSVILYPSIYNIDSSMIINDPSGELSKTIPYLVSKGFRVLTLALGKKGGTLFFNALSKVSSQAEIMKIATQLTGARRTDTKDVFWSQKASECIGMLITFLLESTESCYHHLAQVFRLLEELQGNEDTIARLFSQKASENIWRKFKSILGNSDNTKAGIISTAQASLSFIGDDTLLSDQTSSDNFDFESLRYEKTAVFLTCPVGDVSYYAPLMNIFFELYFNHVFKDLPRESALDVFLLFDEMSSLYLNDLPNIIANSRKFKIPMLMCWQSENQIFQKYGEYNAKTILGNANVKCYFSGLTDESVSLEQTLGEFDYIDKNNDSPRTRSLMTQDEIRTMARNEILVIASSMKPIKTIGVPYYKQRKLRRYMDMPFPKDYSKETTCPKAQFIDVTPYQSEA